MSSLFQRRGYLSLLAAQFFGAANDNILKQVITFMVATGVWSGSLAEGGLGDGGQVVPALLLTIPFILLSGFAGQIADRFSKQRVMWWVKTAEIPIVLIAGVGFLTQNLWLTLGAMLLLAVQSSFFGPAKYGVIPELVEERDLSRANGVLNMLTNIAIIVGSLIAGPVSDLFNPKEVAAEDPLLDVAVGEPNLWAPGAVLFVVALLGFVSILLMPKLRACDPDLKYDFNPFGTYVLSLREMAGGPLLTVALAWSFFYMIGMTALLLIPEYQSILEITFTQTSYLLGILGVAIGIGSVAAGFISGDKIQPTLVPVGATGMTICFLLLGFMPPTYVSVAILLFGAGAFAGFYIIPLQALLQHLSPRDERGRFLGTANGLSFAFSSLGALTFWVATNRLEMPGNKVFAICGGLALIGAVVAVLKFRRFKTAL